MPTWQKWLATATALYAPLAGVVALAHALREDYPAATWFLLVAAVNYWIGRDIVRQWQREHERADR